MGLEESWPSFRFSVAQKKTKTASVSAAHVESQHEKHKLQGSIMQSKIGEGCSSLWNSFIPEWHPLTESLVAKSLKGQKM